MSTNTQYRQYVDSRIGSEKNMLIRFNKKKLFYCIWLIFLVLCMYCLASLKKNKEIVINIQKDSHTFQDGLKEIDWVDYDFIKYESMRKGPGENGKPFIPDSRYAVENSKLYEANGYSGLVSDMVSLNRSIPDIRNPKCNGKLYLSNINSVSVILIYYEEHFSTLLRSIHSIINRTPPSLLGEIILVDDGTVSESLTVKLPKLIYDNAYYKKVKIIKHSKREGLIAARLSGAKAAIYENLVFMDAHSEVNVNWLPPLIDPIARKYTTVTCPFIDVIDAVTFEIKGQDEGSRGAFDWSFYYKRLPLFPESVKNPDLPFKSPVMAGGYFAISARWFWELGGYDPGIVIWGGEQYELSFKIWQCHGQMLDVPCSRIGHVYRVGGRGFPNPQIGNFVAKNFRRVAEVWMDEYKEYLYDRNPGWKTVDYGDISGRLAIRKNLNCNSFDWFIKNVLIDLEEYYPMVEPLPLASGSLINMDSKQCIDTHYGKESDPIHVTDCSKKVEGNITITYRYELKGSKSNACFDLSFHEPGNKIVLWPCHNQKGNQYFKYNPKTHQLYQFISKLCLEPKDGVIIVNHCNETSLKQKWNFDYVNVTSMN